VAFLVVAPERGSEWTGGAESAIHAGLDHDPGFGGADEGVQPRRRPSAVRHRSCVDPDWPACAAQQRPQSLVLLNSCM
jgi:hypothetical protein